jgi:hypothetical protein
VTPGQLVACDAERARGEGETAQSLADAMHAALGLRVSDDRSNWSSHRQPDAADRLPESVAFASCHGPAWHLRAFQSLRNEYSDHEIQAVSASLPIP